jgi:hypothetical protein
MRMLSELQQKDVWENWVGAEIRSNYFADLCSKYQWQQKLLTWLILVCSSGSAAAFITDRLPSDWQWVKPGLALTTACLSIFSLVQQNQKRTTDCADLHFRWSRLGDEYKALWDDMYSDLALDRLRSLEEKEAELSKSSTGFPNKERAMLKWEKYVLEHHGMQVSA